MLVAVLGAAGVVPGSLCTVCPPTNCPLKKLFDCCLCMQDSHGNFYDCCLTLQTAVVSPMAAESEHQSANAAAAGDSLHLHCSC
jgi:hypothetical protein